MARRAGGKTLEISPEDNEELEALCADRGYKRGQLGHILLRYAMSRASEAIKEWNDMGERRTQKRRNAPIPLRIANREE